jgi:ankyrin repeat protein
MQNAEFRIQTLKDRGEVAANVTPLKRTVRCLHSAFCILHYRRHLAGLTIMAAMAVVTPYAAGPANPVIDAVKQGSPEALRTALKRRANVNLPEPDGMTALHWAVRDNDAQAVQLLIRAGANVKAASRYGITPLSLAATNGNGAMVQALIKAGADPNAALPDGETVLMTAARAGDAASVRALIVAGAAVNAREKTQGQTAVTWAAMENNGEAVRVLAEGGADLNATSTTLQFPEFKWITSGMVSTSLPHGGWTPLMYAARQNAPAAARALLESGADPNLTDPEGSTALMLAIVNAHFDLAAMLIEKGVDLNVADSTGMTALYAAVDMHTLGPMLSRPVPKLADKLDASDVVTAMLAKGASPNPRLKRPILGRHHDNGDASLGEGTTPLIRAAKSNDVALMRLLLDGGANPVLTQKDYTNALMVAAGGGGRPSNYAATPSEATALEAVKLCVEKGVDVNAFNANGQTAMHLAAGRGADAIVRYLAEHGAALSVKNKQGRTPLDVAMGQGGRGRGGPPPVHESTATLIRELIAKK